MAEEAPARSEPRDGDGGGGQPSPICQCLVGEEQGSSLPCGAGAEKNEGRDAVKQYTLVLLLVLQYTGVVRGTVVGEHEHKWGCV